MSAALMDDGRKVFIDTSRQQTRLVGGAEFFVDPAYTTVWLDGGWQVVKRSRLKPAEYGSPFGALR